MVSWYIGESLSWKTAEYDAKQITKNISVQSWGMAIVSACDAGCQSSSLSGVKWNKILVYSIYIPPGNLENLMNEYHEISRILGFHIGNH